MKITKREVGFILGILVALLIQFAPIPGLEGQAKTCLALTIMTVIWWAMQIAQNGFTSGVLLALFVILGVASPADVFYGWVGPTMWLVMGAYLIANAVKTSGLGERIAYNYCMRFVSGYTSIIVGVFVLTLILSLLIPHPWPRAFLIMSVMSVIIESSGISKADAVKIGFAVFAASVPLSMVFLTGDSIINPLAASYIEGGMNFGQWFLVMGVPSLACGALTLGLFLLLFKPEGEYSIDREGMRAKLEALGPMSGSEKKVAVWIVVAIVLWLTDKFHGINIGWVTLIVGMAMSMPIIGGVVKAPDWSAIPVHVLVFLTAAMAIGHVGAVTGMNAWIAQTIFPPTVPDNVFVLAAFITVMAIIIHMLLGSVIAVLGVAVPAILTFTAPMGLSPIMPAMICYMAVASHYLFPFQHLNTLVGASPDTGGYTQSETLRLGIPLTAGVFVITVLVMVPWFMAIGVI